mgnify:CR=1 FL=1
MRSAEADVYRMIKPAWTAAPEVNLLWRLFVEGMIGIAEAIFAPGSGHPLANGRHLISDYLVPL